MLTKNVSLFCTMPSWNKRLEKALTELLAGLEHQLPSINRYDDRREMGPVSYDSWTRLFYLSQYLTLNKHPVDDLNANALFFERNHVTRVIKSGPYSGK